MFRHAEKKIGHPERGLIFN